MPFQYIFFDCDSTLSAVEGIDELAREKGLFDDVQRLTNAAMDGEVHLESVYDRRLQLLRPTRGEIRRLAQKYRETVIVDAAAVIAALQFLGKTVFIVSGGLLPAVRPFGEWLGVPAENIRAVDVAYNSLSGEWWNYQKDHWGERPDVQYLKHDEGPLVQSTGKIDVVRRLQKGHPARSLLVGDGISDLAARPAVNRFIGFGGVVRREAVARAADIFITAPELSPVLALATDAAERVRLQNSPFAAVLARGLELLASAQVTFANTAWRNSAIRG